MLMITVISFSVAVVDRLLVGLRQQFAIKYLGDLHYFLGIKVCHLRSGFSLNQHKYGL
jgi:hypothetical protein